MCIRDSYGFQANDLSTQVLVGGAFTREGKVSGHALRVFAGRGKFGIEAHSLMGQAAFAIRHEFAVERIDLFASFFLRGFGGGDIYLFHVRKVRDLLSQRSMLGAQLAQIIRTQFRGKGAGGGIEVVVLRTVRLMGFFGRSC